MKVLAITQARISSTRLPAKVLKMVNDKTLLQIHLSRIKKSKMISNLVVATTNSLDDDKIVELCKSLGVDFYRGSMNNVLERFYLAAINYTPDWIVRLTSDCPLIDPVVIDGLIEFATVKNLDYASNTLEPTFPDGLDVEVFKFSALKKAYHEATLTSELEHVTPYIWKNSTYKGGNIFVSECYSTKEDLSKIRLTVDTLDDFKVIEHLLQEVGFDNNWIDYVNYLNKYPEIFEINSMYKRNEGYQKSLNIDK